MITDCSWVISEMGLIQQTQWMLIYKEYPAYCFSHLSAMIEADQRPLFRNDSALLLNNFCEEPDSAESSFYTTMSFV